MTFGLAGPVIVWPPEATTWRDDDLRRTIVHELEHVRRRDWLVHSGAYVTAALYWFHPLVWIARRRLGVEAERACDDAVLRGTDGPAYAEQLLRLARHLSTTVAQPGMSIASPSDLAIRVAAVLDRRQARHRITRRSAALMALAATGLLVAVAPLRAVIAGAGDMGPSAPALGARRTAVRTAAQGPGSPPLIPGGANVLVGRVVTLGSDDPVGGAVVTLVGYFDTAGRPLPHNEAQESPRLSASAPRQVLTTADGSFLFRDLPAGPYNLSVDAFGYSDDTPIHLIELTDRKTPTEPSLRVWKASTISGRVADERGEPVVGVTVTAFRAAGTASGLVLRGGLANAVTDDRGAYRLASLRPGRYAVGVTSSSLSLPGTLAGAIDATASNRDESWALTTTLLNGGGDGPNPAGGEGQRVGDFVLQRSGPPPLIAPDGRMLTYPTTLYPGTPTLGEAIVIPLGSGEDRAGVDLPIRFAPAVAVSGIATGPDGPMANLTVNLMPPSGATDWDYETTQTATGLLNWRRRIGVPQAITNASGAFRFLAVSPGAYALTAEFHTFPPPASGTVGFSLWASQPLTVGDHDVASLAVTLTPGAHVSGRVVFTDQGQELPPGNLTSWSTPTMSGTARVQVNLLPIGAETFGIGAGPSRVAPDGTFSTVGSAKPGLYMVHAYGPPGWTFAFVSRGGKLAPDDVIEVDAADVTDVVITFTKTPTRVSGSIAGVNGAPDDNADVFVFPADTTLWREGIFPPATRRVRMLPAMSGGTFDLSGLPPGAYYLAAVATRFVGDWQDPAFLDRLTPGATRITLGAGETKTVPLVTITPRDR
jgi:hypothetical protein